MKLSELAEQTGARLEGGDADTEISGAAGLDEAAAGHVTFLANPRYTPRAQTTQPTAIFVSENVEDRRELALLRASDPQLPYTRALTLFHPEPSFEPFIHPTPRLDSTALIGDAGRR